MRSSSGSRDGRSKAFDFSPRRKKEQKERTEVSVIEHRTLDFLLKRIELQLAVLEFLDGLKNDKYSLNSCNSSYNCVLACQNGCTSSPFDKWMILP